MCNPRIIIFLGLVVTYYLLIVYVKTFSKLPTTFNVIAIISSDVAQDGGPAETIGGTGS